MKQFFGFLVWFGLFFLFQQPTLCKCTGGILSCGVFCCPWPVCNPSHRHWQNTYAMLKVVNGSIHNFCSGTDHTKRESCKKDPTCHRPSRQLLSCLREAPHAMEERGRFWGQVWGWAGTEGGCLWKTSWKVQLSQWGFEWIQQDLFQLSTEWHFKRFGFILQLWQRLHSGIWSASSGQHPLECPHPLSPVKNSGS